MEILVDDVVKVIIGMLKPYEFVNLWATCKRMMMLKPEYKGLPHVTGDVFRIKKRRINRYIGGLFKYGHLELIKDRSNKLEYAMYAVLNGHIDLVKKYIAEHNLNDQSVVTLYRAACRSGRVEVVDMLRDKSTAQHHKSMLNNVPFGLCSNGKFELALSLGMSLDGMLPFACEKGNMKIINKCLGAGVAFTQNCLAFAGARNKLNVYKFIESRMGVTKAHPPRACIELGPNVLEYLYKTGRLTVNDVFARIPHNKMALRLMIESGSKPDQVIKIYFNICHGRKNIKTARNLFALGVSIDELSVAMIKYVCNNYTRVINFILECGMTYDSLLIILCEHGSLGYIACYKKYSDHFTHNVDLVKKARSMVIKKFGKNVSRDNRNRVGWLLS